MDDHNPRGQQGRRRYSEPRAFVSLAEQRHRQIRQCRAEAPTNEEPYEAPLVGVTRRLVRVTWALVFVGVCSIGAALLQWDALRSTDNTTREAFTGVQRAFVTVIDVSIHRGSPDRYPGGIAQSKFWEVWPAIENSGSTPTKNLRWMNALSVTARQEENPDRFAVDIEKTVSDNSPSPWNYGILGPKSKMTLDYGGNRVFLSEQVISQLPEIKRLGGHLLWQGVIRYNDIFAKTPEHITKFCYLVGADQLEGKGEIGDPFVTQCGGYTNCADQECDAK